MRCCSVKKIKEYYDGIPREIKEMTPEQVDNEIKNLEEKEKK